MIFYTQPFFDNTPYSVAFFLVHDPKTRILLIFLSNLGGFWQILSFDQTCHCRYSVVSHPNLLKRYIEMVYVEQGHIPPLN